LLASADWVTGGQMRLSSLDIDLPNDFPSRPYSLIHSKLAPRRDERPTSWDQWAGAWNAVAYRYLSCFEHDQHFTGSVKKFGCSPGQPHRYFQERELFGFFTTGLSGIEALHFGLFAIASYVKPNEFLLSTDDELRAITPASTTRQFEKCFAAETVTSVLREIQQMSQYEEWNLIRNILIHRTHPGRAAYLGGPNDGLILWVRGITLDDQTTSSRRTWLSEVMNKLLSESCAFCDEHL
jgi:hypothetical protein